MKHLILLIVLFAACNQNKPKLSKEVNAVSNDTISPARKNVSKTPVAEYIVTMDAKLDRKFGVRIFETQQTFKYLLVMYYDAMVEKDTLTIPNFGMWPVVKVKPGNEKLSCIIGFLDVRNDFREYKMLSAKNDHLKLTTLKIYGVATYYK